MHLRLHLGACHGIAAVACFLVATTLVAQDLGPAPLPNTAAPGPSTNTNQTKAPGNGDAELDSILDLDLKSLGKIAVRESTFTDPIVEGVSKTSEKASEAPGIVDVITAQDIEDFGAKNLYEVLQWATSVYMTGSFMLPRNVAAIRGDLRKHEDNLVLVLINGRPFRDTTLGGINVSIYTAFPIQTIERIEVIRGPGSVLYGTNAFDGVINVVTKNPKKPTLHASVLSGSFGWQSYSMAVGNGNKDRGYYGGATCIREKGWPFTATLEPPSTTETELFGQDNMGVFAMYRNGGLTANLFVAKATSDIVGSSVEWPSLKLDTPRVFLDMGYLLELNQSRSLDLHFTYNYDGTQFPSVLSTPTTEVPFIAPAHSFLLEGTYRAELSDGFNLMIGGVTDIHTGGAVMRPLVPIPWFREIWYSAYLQLDYQVNDWLKLVGGMQGNMPGTIRGGIVPRAGVIASLSDNWTAKFLYGQAFRSPYQIERSIDAIVVLGNPDLVPETIQTFDVQLAYHTDEFRFAATYFHSDLFDMITRVGTIPETYVNLGGMEFQGVELENEWRLSDHWRWLGSVTYQNNIRDGEHNVTAAPIWMAKMGMAYHNDNGLHVSLMDVFYGACAADSDALHVNPEPDEYHLATLNMRLDLNRRFDWHMNRQMDLQFMIQNVFNEPINHVEFQRGVINTLPAGPGRAFYGGFTMAY
ncbi:MAG: TonB-dependent receptor [Pirellulales bacterium]|nr:TonB-dependent receptor [Pirellulales bacterium]